MQVSVIIPVWNGAEVIAQCLEAVYAHSGPALLEVICVNNASHDDSATLIAAQFPQVRLLNQPVNLGFAGGVNVGLEVASGDILILLNQDCLVHENWLMPLIATFEISKQVGIVGCTILNADGSLNHAGAYLQQPGWYGQHFTEIKQDTPYAVDYLNGALFALHRQTWQTVGRFDEDFYPAYYEESDYCYRARAKGWDVLFTPQTQATHLFSSREWQADPMKHAANQHLARFRFICKHVSPADFVDFCAAEEEAIAAEIYMEHAAGRAIAGRELLRNLSGVMARRQLDLNEEPSSTQQRLFQVGFINILRRAFGRAKALAISNQNREQILERLDQLRQQEYELLRRIYCKAPGSQEPESTLRRYYRLVVLRPLSFLSGRAHLLSSQLNTLHVVRMDLMQSLQNETDSRLKLIETLIDYDYR